MYGISVSDLQTDVAVGDDAITGTLSYITTGWDAGTWGATEAEGNYLALSLSATPGATITAELVGSGKPAKVISDGYVVARITEDVTAIKFTATLEGKTIYQTYSLEDLVLEADSSVG